MKRDLESLKTNVFDLVIVGGGITGACIARDATQRGLSVALVDKHDFASATTAASSKLIHGGLRYLQNLELGLVRESLRERRIWSNTAPHLVDPITFLMPTTGSRIRDRMFKAIGLTLYDWLAYDRNRLEDPEKAIPSRKQLSREEVLALEPGLESDDLTGAMVFYDCQMHSPERLALEGILDAAAAGAVVANYAEVVEFMVDEDRVTGVRVRDAAPGAPTNGDGATFDVRGRLVINAAGPWADLLMAALQQTRASAAPDAPERDAGPGRHLIRSKGIHLITRSLTHGHAIAVPSESSHFFILPWRGHSLLGTTDTVYKGAPDDVYVSEKDIVDFLAVVNAGYPGARLRRSDVLYFYGGLRPIVDTTSTTRGQAGEDADEPDSYGASRAAEVYDHTAEEGLEGMLTVIGGKWTTSRHLAEEVTDLAVKKLDRDEAPPCRTDKTPTYGGNLGRFTDYTTQVLETYSALPAAVVMNLVKNYGTRFEEVLALTKENPLWMEQLSDEFPDLAAAIVYAVRHEMALTVEDVLFRRTGLGTLGTPGDALVKRIADLMAEELGWDDPTRSAQIDRAVAKFTSWARTRAIVNPRSSNGQTGLLWPSIETKLGHAIGPVEAVFTDGPMDAERLTAQALRDGAEQIIAVGGDGTINEVVNGFFENGRPINPEALLAVLTCGTGGDLRRVLGAPQDIDDQVQRLATSEIRSIDLGKLTYVDENGKECVRFFDNVASFGLSGATDRAVNRLTFAKKFGGKFAFLWGMFKALVMYKNQRVRIQVDDAFNEVVNVCTAAVCNGQYFGGGMRIAPDARLDDGLFDVIIVADLGRLELLQKVNSIYRGEHLQYNQVTALQGRRITATPVDGARDVLLDVDGEAPGRLPATFEIVPEAIYLRA